MTHDEARLLASARADGEPSGTEAAGLDAHLGTCADCAAYAAGLDRLRALTAALPREPAPGTLPVRVAARVRRARRRRWVLRTAPVLAAATAVAVVLSVLPGPASFPLPDAAAAEPLLTLRSLYVERTVTDAEGRHHERIWWRAPGSVRVERDGAVTIRTPEASYENGVLTTGVAPVVALPEPLSSSIALLGRDTGPGPTVAGRPTRRYALTLGGEQVVAWVDTARAVALGAEESFVVAKVAAGVTKRVTDLRLNADVPDALFAPPPGAVRTEGGFRGRSLGSLRIAPRARPEGFALVRAGRGPDGDAALFARGSLPVLVRTPGAEDPTGEVRTVERAGRIHYVTLRLYGAPAVQVDTPRGAVVVSAPLPVDSLVALADAMYPE